MGAVKSEQVISANIISDPSKTPVEDAERAEVFALFTPRYKDFRTKKWVNGKTTRIKLVFKQRNAELVRDMFQSGALNVGAPVIAVGWLDDVNEIQVSNGEMSQTLVFTVQQIGRDLLKETALQERRADRVERQDSSGRKPYRGGNNPYRRNSNGYPRNNRDNDGRSQHYEAVQELKNDLASGAAYPTATPRTIEATPGPHLTPIAKRLPQQQPVEAVQETQPVTLPDGTQPAYSTSSL